MQKTRKKWWAALLLLGILLQVPAFATEQRNEMPSVVKASLPDGTQVCQTTEVDGSVTTVKTMADGAMMTTVDTADGCDSTTRVENDGTTMAAVSLSREAIQSAHGEAIPLALPALDGVVQPHLTVSLPDKTPVTVAIPLQTTSQVTAFRVEKDGGQIPLTATMEKEALVVTLVDGDTIILQA